MIPSPNSKWPFAAHILANERGNDADARKQWNTVAELAQKTIKELPATSNRQSFCLLSLATAYGNLGKINEAIALLEQSLAKDKQNARLAIKLPR